MEPILRNQLYLVIIVILLLVICASQTKASDVPSQCVSGTYMKSLETEDGHRCVADCGPGFYGDDDSKACQPCQDPCFTCSMTANNCTSCSQPHYLQFNRCVLDCGSMLSRGPARSRIRLSGGNNAFEGRVEILHEGVWGTVCDDMWDLLDAQVVCRELQLGPAVEALNISDTSFGEASPRTPIHLDNLECHGSESKLEFCPHLEWGRHNCAHNEDAAVRCAGPDMSRLCVTSCGDGYYNVPRTKRCELCSPECLTCTDRPDHCLTCQAPRFLQGDRCVENCGSGHHGNTVSRTCERCHENCNNCFDGSSNSVCSSCKDHLYLDGRRCVESCDPKLSKNLAIRLVGGTSAYEGRVEVYINGEWGTVCDDGWDINDAQVVCRELGYGSAQAAVSAPGFGAGSGPILMNHVQCVGTEAELVHCLQSTWMSNQCRHTEDAGVRCVGEQSMVSGWGILLSALTHPGATGRCLDACGRGYYLPAPNDYECAACSSNCLTCRIDANQCTSCKPSTFLQGSACVESCGPTKFGNTAVNRCERCDLIKCGTCEDGTQNDICKSCPTGKVLKGSSCILSCGPDMFSQSGVCQERCDDSYYGNPASFICQTCSIQCLTCGFNQEYSIVCTSCRAPKVLSNGQCVDGCPSSTFVVPMDPSTVPNGDQIRLVGGQDQLEGRLEVFHDGQWGTVCSDQWSISSARVACKQLNLGQVEAVLRIRSSPGIEPGEGPIWLDNVFCRGLESNLDECSHSDWGQNDCNHLKDVALRCTGPGIRECVAACPDGYYTDTQSGQCIPCLNGCLRCVNQPTYTCQQCQPGTLLSADNQCVEECASGFHPSLNNSNCLPCDDSCATCFSRADYCTSCKGELVLQDHTCVQSCDGYKLVLTDRIRLAGATSPLEGRVEVLNQGEFGTVCDDLWGIDEANIVCAELGLGRALRATREASHGEGTGSIVLDNVACNGDEPSILACAHNGLGINNCEHSEDAGVVCSGPMASNICIQPSDCTAGFFVAADSVTCVKCSYNCLTCANAFDTCTSCPEDRYLSKDNTCLEGCPDGFYGDSDRKCQPCSENCLDCSESPTHCTSCVVTLYLQSGSCVEACDSNMVIKKGPPDIRLVGGSNHFAGRVEVKYNGAWGTVCDDDFDTNDANVICRQLQMGLAIQAYSEAHFGEGSGSIVLDDLRCNGDEDSIMDCPSSKLGVDNVDCLHYEDAGVQCSGPGSALHCLENCGEGYFTSDTRVCEHCETICHECEGSSSNCVSCLEPLYLMNSTCTERCPAGYYGNTNSQQCVACTGNCKECFDGAAGNVCQSCKPGFYLQGSSCVSQCHQGSILENVLPQEASSPQIRLAGSSLPNEGRVEVLHRGKWGTVCTDDWDLIDGEVVCQQLGLGHAVEVMASGAYGGVAIDTPIWLDSVDCKGWEFSLTQCSHEGLGGGECRAGLSMSNGDAAVRCDGSSSTRPPKNICRDVMSSPCQKNTCNPDVVCVDLSGQRSVCLECPEGQVGTGKDCTMVANSLPEFENAPEDKQADLGSPATLRCRAKAGSAPTVKAQNWLKDGQPLSQAELDSERVIALNFGSLYLTSTRREDTGNYTCIIKNTQGYNTASAILTIQEPPQIMTKKDDTVAIGDSATLGCNVVGLPPSSITWRYNGKSIADVQRFTSFAENGTLVIRNVTHEDEGGYQCFAENDKGTSNTIVKLTVQEPPQFTVRPAEVMEVEQGASVSMNCQAQGKPKPRIHWKKDGNELPRVENKYTIKPMGDLSLVNVDASDMGTYSCLAANTVQTSSLSTRLLVNGPPVFVVRPSNQTLSTGETIFLHCEIMGTHDPVISWVKDGEAIKGDDHFTLRSDGLLIRSVSQDDTGDYTCVGTNKEGSVESSAYLSIHAPVFGKQQTVGIIWVFIVIIIILLIVIVSFLVLYLRRRYKQQALFNHTRLNRSPKKSNCGLGVKFTERSNGSYVEIEKQKAKDERELQTKGIMEDVDIV